MKILILSALLLSVVARAENEDFAKHKTEVMAHVEERMQKLQELKSCVNSAADKEAMKACHKDMKEWRQGEREERMEKRKGRMEERMKKMEEKKKK
jgi:hypothetical protein